MKKKLLLIPLVLLLALSPVAIGCSLTPTPPSPPARAIDAIVSTQWLEDNIDNPNLVILDVREPDYYTAGHIPGSVNAPAFPNWVVNFPGEEWPWMELPEDEALFTTIGNAGISADSTVVVIGRTVDSPSLGLALGGVVFANRVAITLIYAGVENVAMLDGGYDLWAVEERAISTEPVTPTAVTYTGVVDETIFVSKDYVEDKVGKSILVDTREADMYYGIEQDPSSERAGHIPIKTALHDTYEFVQLSGQAGAIPKLRELDVNLMVNETIKGINPELTIPRLVLNNIRIPAHIFKLIGEEFKEAMAYPEIDIPMYKPLVDISTELFLPNINFIEQNSISLLETNQKFIESYMVGLNHEFARELLWREYPTDQRGSYFRQFWDVIGYLDTENLDEEALKEKLRDIPPLHRWSKSSNLGDHDYREEQGDKEEEAVLVIRGELLKKYPTAVIYAHKAEWQRKEDGTIDNTRERQLVELTDEELKNPPRDKVKTPLYEAKVDPDIYFFGFDLTIEEAKGGTGENPDDKPGWFFIIKERPGEPRFGLDIDQSEKINVWNDLAWKDVVPGATAGDFINIDAGTPTISLDDPHGDTELQEKYEQYDEDMHLTWNKDMNAAEVAYVLYQVPVLVGVHASEMLPKK